MDSYISKLDFEQIKERFESYINNEKLNLDTKNISNSKTKNAIRLLKKGTNKVHSGKYEMALIDLNNALELDKTLCDAYFYKGFALRELFLFDESIIEFMTALSINNKHIATLFQISYSLNVIKRYDISILFLNRLVEISPDWHAYMNRASVREALGDIPGMKEDEEAAWEMGHDFSVF